MNCVVILHRLATREVRSAQQWNSSRSPNSERRFIAALDAAIDRIGQNPDAGSPFMDSFRWVRLNRFPYLLYYERYQHTVEVYAVAHGSRRPGYWLRRTKKA